MTDSFVIPAAGWGPWRPSIFDLCEVCPHTYAIHNIFCSECKTITGVEHEFMVRVVPEKVVQGDHERLCGEIAELLETFLKQEKTLHGLRLAIDGYAKGLSGKEPT